MKMLIEPTLLRAVLKIGAGMLIARGTLTDDQAEQLIGAICAIAGVLWGLRDAKKTTPPLALWLAVALPLALTGCAVVTQESTTTEPGTGLVHSARTRIYASGDSKAIVDKIRASASQRTATVGAEGASTDSQLSATMTAFAGLISKAIEAGVAAGKAAAGQP